MLRTNGKFSGAASDQVDMAAYRADRNPTSLVSKNALLNHLLGLQILHSKFC